MGERTEPCGTPFGMFFVVDDLPLYDTYDCLPVK